MGWIGGDPLNPQNLLMVQLELKASASQGPPKLGAPMNPMMFSGMLHPPQIAFGHPYHF